MLRNRQGKLDANSLSAVICCICIVCELAAATACIRIVAKMSTVFVSDAGSFIGERIVRTLKTQAAVGVIKGSYRKSDEQHPKVCLHSGGCAHEHGDALCALRNSRADLIAVSLQVSTTQALDAALSSDVIVLNLHTAVDEAVAVAEGELLDGGGAATAVA